MATKTVTPREALALLCSASKTKLLEYCRGAGILLLADRLKHPKRWNCAIDRINLLYLHATYKDDDSIPLEVRTSMSTIIDYFHVERAKHFGDGK